MDGPRRRSRLSPPVVEALFTLSVLTLAMIGVTIGLTVWLAGGGNGAEAATPAETAPAETAPADTEAAETETAEAETETAETEAGTETVETEAETEAAPAAGDPAGGEQVFASAGCGSCHTLAAAGSSGQIGPNLDESQPPLDLVVDRVTNGQGAMPAFAGTLSEQEIQDVAAYVVQSTGG